MLKKNLSQLIYIAIGFFSLLTAPLVGDDFPFDPPKNFTLKTEYIGIHHPVDTSNITAQLYFDQGLTFIYAFNHDAAYWSFLRAAQADPNLAMAYWGMALVLGSNINMETTPLRAKKAYEYVHKAAQLAENGLQSEKDYISALMQRYSNDPKPDINQLNKNFSTAMLELSNKYPDDLDAAVLSAESILDVTPWKQWSLSGEPLEGTKTAVEKLDSVLKRDPKHLGANHYYIHAIEASSHPERALICAERLKTLLPSSGHILHMPAHIYLLVGDYHKAALANEDAIAADREYIREYGLDGIYPLHYLTHNLYFLSRAYSMAGCYHQAKRAAEELSEFYTPHFKAMPSLEYYIPSPMFVLLRFHKWQDILAIPQPSEEMTITRVFWHFGRSIAFVNLENFTQAKEEQRLFLEGKAKISAKATYGFNNASKLLTIAQYSIEATLAKAQNQSVQAIDAYQKAIAIQDSLNYNEPPDWFFPIREALGGILLQQKQYSAAEKIFREDLALHPLNGRSLFGLQESLQAQAKYHDLFWIKKAFQQAWMYSDIKLKIEEL